MTATTARALTSVAARLTQPENRETYAGPIAYFESLPDHGELFHIVELVGLLSLLGQRMLAALADAMTDLRELTTKGSGYHTKVDELLPNLPREIARGLNVERWAMPSAGSHCHRLANVSRPAS